MAFCLESDADFAPRRQVFATPQERGGNEKTAIVHQSRKGRQCVGRPEQGTLAEPGGMAIDTEASEPAQSRVVTGI